MISHATGQRHAARLILISTFVSSLERLIASSLLVRQARQDHKGSVGLGRRTDIRRSRLHRPGLGFTAADSVALARFPCRLKSLWGAHIAAWLRRHVDPARGAGSGGLVRV